MAPASLAPLAEAHGRFAVRLYIVRAPGHRDRAGLPKAECIDRARGPVAAGFAMAVAPRNRFAAHGEFNCAAEATRLVISHVPPPSNRPFQRHPLRPMFGAGRPYV